MADTADTGNGAATEQEDPFKGMRDAEPWLADIKESEDYFADYHERCDNIDKLYANLKRLVGDNADREMQVFWANLEVLKPSIYARQPVPVVAARFNNRGDLLRHSCEIIERSLISSFDMQDIHESLKLVRDDLASKARGVEWLRYEKNDDGSYEAVCYDHLNRKDFAHDTARKWKEVGWVARRSWLTHEEMRDRFQEASGDAYLSAEYSERREQDGEKTKKLKAAVWEIWHKVKNVVVWVSPGVREVLDIVPPFLELDRFFPCPRPAYGTLEPDTLRPVPDFLQYRDQLEEINELTARISALSERLRMVGFYSAGGEDIADAIETAMNTLDNRALLIKVPTVAAMGVGLKDAILWMPVDQVAATIMQLINLRRTLINDVYEVSGLSDIMRGSTDPNETLGAQQLKSQYGSIRIRDRQEEMVRIARDSARIAGEIMAENFSPETLLAMAQYNEVPTREAITQQIGAIQAQVRRAAADPQMVAQAQQNPEMAKQALEAAQQQIEKLKATVTIDDVIAFLRDQRMRPFALDIETDSTIQADENAAKQRSNEFLTALSTALAQLTGLVEKVPQAAEFAGEVVKFAVAPYRAGRSLSTAIDNFVELMKQQASQPRPNPEAEKQQAQMQANAAKEQREASESHRKLAMDEAETKASIDKIRAEIDEIYARIDRIHASREEAAVKTATQLAN